MVGWESSVPSFTEDDTTTTCVVANPSASFRRVALRDASAEWYASAYTVSIVFMESIADSVCPPGRAVSPTSPFRAMTSLSKSSSSSSSVVLSLG